MINIVFQSNSDNHIVLWHGLYEDDNRIGYWDIYLKENITHIKIYDIEVKLYYILHPDNFEKQINKILLLK